MARTEARRYQSFKLADELRQTSDDLTRMARRFVVTADDRYKHYFDEILAIREESVPRPLDCGNIYWILSSPPASRRDAPGSQPRWSVSCARLNSLTTSALC